MEQRKTIDLSELIDLSDMEPATPTPDAAVPDDAAQPSPAAPEPQKADFLAKALAAGKAFLTWLWGKLKAFAAWLWAKLKARWAWFKVQPPERKRLALAGAAACLAIVLGLTAVVIALSTNARQAAAAAVMEAEPKPAAVQRTVLPENADELGPTEDWEDFAAADTEPLYTALKKHDTSDEVTVLQERLIALGYLEIDEPTDYYGSATEYAVKLFQRQHDLEQDGVAGDQTLTLLYSDEAQKYTLKEGAEGRDVKMLQEQLVDLGYLSSKQVDSVYGEVTQAAVVAFQKRNSLTADGKREKRRSKSCTATTPRCRASLPPSRRPKRKPPKRRPRRKPPRPRRSKRPRTRQRPRARRSTSLFRRRSPSSAVNTSSATAARTRSTAPALYGIA
ncbi:MAG: peptidoglycan-binding protein [Clostridia bacterium]|nr:peptidoglycan-binding protein [Clostridia bacterium]